MKGSEKQINWATEICENVISALNYVIASASTSKVPEAVREATIQRLQLYIDRLNEDDVYAGDVIDLFRNIRFGGNQNANAMSVAAIYNNPAYVPITTGEKRLLGRD